LAIREIVFPDCAGTEDYKKVLEEILASQKCPFCPENFFIKHKKPIISEKDNWFITESQWPYPKALYHFLIIGREHKEKLNELTEKDLAAVAYLSDLITEEKKLEGGGLALRFGDGRLSGATVAHLHFHLIFPERNEDGLAEAVWFPIGPK